MANNKDIKNATLIGKAYYVFNRKPHHDKDNDKDLYKLDLVLTNPDGTPIIRKNKKTGEEVNMVQRAEELGLILKEPRGTIEGTHVKIKREVRKLKDGSYTLPPETKDATGADFTEIIGNESEVRVEFAAIPISKGKFADKNCSAYLNKIIVLKHVPYAGSMSEEFEFDSEDSKAPVKKSTTSSKKEVEESLDDTLDDFED